MPKSTRIRADDFRAIIDIVGECRDQGDDPVVWRKHFFAKTAGLIGADIVIGGELEVPPGGPPKGSGSTDWGWEAGFDRLGWENAQREFATNPNYDPAMLSFLSKFTEAGGAASLARQQLATEREWYGALVFEVAHSVVGTDACLYCFAQLPSDRTALSGMIPSREAGRRLFDERECQLAQELHSAILPLIGGPLARFNEPSPSELPPRPRQVLKCLLEGDGDKQVARRLQISVHTVNQYKKAIYKHFGVASQPELLARWVRRGWGASAKWLDAI